MTSCPSVDGAQEPGDLDWSQSLLPECLPRGHRLEQPLLPLGERSHQLLKSISVAVDKLILHDFVLLLSRVIAYWEL